MVNPVRGEIAAELGGKQRRLCLTLGALAELEAALGAEDLVSLAARFEDGRIRAQDCIAILSAGLRAAGEDVTSAEVAAFAGTPEVLQAVVRLLTATFSPPA